MPSASLTPLEQLLCLNNPFPDLSDQLSDILRGQEYRLWAGRADRDEVARLVNFLDKALDALVPTSPGFWRCLRELRHVCGTIMALPRSYTLPSQALTVGRQPVATGGTGDLYEGMFSCSKVCVKRVRVCPVEGPWRATKMLCQEAVMWKRLEHKNIVPLLGVTMNPLQLISEWMTGGELTEYVGKHPDTNRLGLACDIAEGLYYLHSRNIIHGDLRGPNILVDDTRRPRIANFSFATVIRTRESVRTPPMKRGRAVRWTAPEVLNEKGPYSKAADVFSFAMVMIEVFTGAIPFNQIPASVVAFGILEGIRPPRPTHPEFTDDLWALVQRCWNCDPCLRPEVSWILDVLRSTRNHPLGTEPVEDPPEDRLLTSPDAVGLGGFTPPSNLPPQKLAETNGEWQGDLAQQFIDRVDMALDHATCHQERDELLNFLCKICSRQRMLPKSMHVKGELTGELTEAYHGGHAQIFQAQRDNHQVAVKIIRITMSSDFDRCYSEFCREVIAWRHLRHPNILPLLGVDLGRHRLAMISEWMDQGNINEYVKRHGGANCLQLLVDAATGLEYMHGLNMVHGDLKGANILINQSHRACLADFGLSTIARVEHNNAVNTSSVSVVSKASLVSFTAGGTFPWMSPELLHPERFGACDARPTKKSDCYALGMVVYEVLSRKSPYWDIRDEISLIFAIMEGSRPNKPEKAESVGFTKELWKTVQQCWLADASARPDVGSILSHLDHATRLWKMGHQRNRSVAVRERMSRHPGAA